MADYRQYGTLGALPKASAAFVAGEQIPIQRANNQLGQLSALVNLQGMMEQRQRQQQAAVEQQQLEGVLQQTGGDPQRAITALVASGKSAAIALAAKLQSALPKAQSIGAGGLRLADGTVIGPQARPTTPTESPLARLRRERAGLPEGHPDIPVYEDAIRKESQTAKQISPTVIMPERPHPIIGVDAQGNQVVNWASPSQGSQTFPTRPVSVTTSGNQQALALRRDYNANPEVRLANAMEPKVGPMADYIATIGRGMGNSVGDAELVKLWLMTTHPKGDQISNLDYRSIEKMPDLWGRVKNVAGNFVFGKTLDSETRASMWKSISEKYKATAESRTKYRSDILGRAKAMTLNEDAIFPKVE